MPTQETENLTTRNGLTAIQLRLERLRSNLDQVGVAEDYSDEASAQEADAPEIIPIEIVDDDDLEAQRLELNRQRLRLAAERAELDQKLAEYKAAQTAMPKSNGHPRPAPQEDEAESHRLIEELKEEALAVRKQAEALEIQRKYAREVVEQRNAVMELQRLLADAEQRMIRRWGIHQAFGWSIRAMICLAILLGLSYFVGGNLATRQWVSSAVVRHLGMEVASTPSWLNDQRDYLLSNATLRRTAGQLRQSDYAGTAHPDELKRIFSADLKLSSPGANVLHLELHGHDDEALTPLLNALVRAYATHDSAVADDETDTFMPRMHIAQQAKLSPVPVFDNRAELITMLFGASAGITGVIVLVFGFLAIRTARAEVATLEVGSLGDGDVWKAYHDALDRPSAAETQPLF